MHSSRSSSFPVAYGILFAPQKIVCCIPQRGLSPFPPLFLNQEPLPGSGACSGKGGVPTFPVAMAHEEMCPPKGFRDNHEKRMPVHLVLAVVDGPAG